MKKLLALLLTLVFTLSLAACSKSDTSSDNSSISAVLSQDEPSETEISTEQSSESVAESETESKAENNSSNTSSDKKTVSSKPSTQTQNSSSHTQSTSQGQNSSSQPEPTQSTKLNPKTNFKFGKYVAKYFDNDNQCYYETFLEFFKDFEGLQYNREHFYTKEYCKKKYQDWEMEFNEENFSYEYSITLKGITYYNLGDYDILSEAYKITDTVIKISHDLENWSELSLNADGTLVLESTPGNDRDRYGKVGTVFTLAEYE